MFAAIDDEVCFQRLFLHSIYSRVQWLHLVVVVVVVLVVVVVVVVVVVLVVVVVVVVVVVAVVVVVVVAVVAVVVVEVVVIVVLVVARLHRQVSADVGFTKPRRRIYPTVGFHRRDVICVVITVLQKEVWGE